MRSCSRRLSIRGFTLVELLVVMAVISLLAGLLLPALQGAMKSARRLNCSNNLKTIDTALLLYADDHSDFFPTHYNNSSSWPHHFSDWAGTSSSKLTNFYAEYGKFGKSIYYCREGLENPDGRHYDNYNKFPSGLNDTSLNYTYFGGPRYMGSGVYRNDNQRGDGPVKSTASPASRYCLISDLMRFGENASFWVLNESDRGWNHVDGSKHDLSGAGGNMAYVDGHVKWHTGADKLEKMRHPMRGNWDKAYCTERPGDL